MTRSTTGVIAVVLAALGPCALAQQPPTGGAQIQLIQPPPVPQAPQPEIRVEPGRAPAAPGSDQTRIPVRSLRVTNAQVYSEVELLKVAGFQPGSELTLTELRAMASRIADHYRRNGYFVAQAYVPAQDIKDGEVTIAVIEGQYGNITLRNQSNVSDSLPSSLLGGLESGDRIAIAPLESRLLLLSDIPGVSVKSTLIPGASVGASDLIVDVMPGQRVTGSVDADNEGNRYSGRNRVGGTLTVNNPSGHGDVATVRALTSTNGFNYGRAAYQAQIGRARIGAAYAAMEYRLGKEFESLQAHGTARIASLYGSYPLIRSRGNNLNAQLAYDAKTFQDKVNSTSSVTDKKADVAMASLSGDHRDALLGAGLSTYSATWTHGRIDIQTPAARAADAASVQSNGDYDKFALNAARLQSVTETVSLYAAINGQLASKNLDLSEKMGLGGPYAVRAYPAGEAYGDQGYILNLEARALLPKFFDALPGRMELVGFIDTGTVTLNKNPFAAGQNRRTLSGAGVGIQWVDSNNFVLKAYWAHKLGNAVATSAPDSPSRFWLQGVKFF